jgi:hypothetical protein
MMTFLLLLLLLAAMGSATSNTLYKYNISGTIYSTSENGVDKVMPNMHIDLMEDDNWFWTHDLLGQAVTDGHGHFEGLVGEEDEGNEPEPFLRIPMKYCRGVLSEVCPWVRKSCSTKIFLKKCQISTVKYRQISAKNADKLTFPKILRKSGFFYCEKVFKIKCQNLFPKVDFFPILKIFYDI